MAVVTRYFSTTSAGAGDGTTWADRAQLDSAGSFSTIITGFNFSADSLIVAIGPGTYNVSGLTSGAFTSTAPTVGFPVILHGCDSSGNILSPPSPGWTADMAEWDSSSLPNISVNGSTNVFNLLTQGHARLIRISQAGSGTIIGGLASADWCYITSSGSASCGVIQRSSNCVFKMSGSGYSSAVLSSSTTMSDLYNCKIFASVAGSSGARHGLSLTSTQVNAISKCCITGFAGTGISFSGTTTSGSIRVHNCVVSNNSGAGISLPNTASQAVSNSITGCMLTGNGTYGIDPQTNARTVLFGNRLRDNTTSNFGNFGQFPTNLGNYTTDSDDTSEYVDSSSGDFRIKYGSSIWGNGYGVSDQPQPTGGGGGGSGGLGFNNAMNGGFEA